MSREKPILINLIYLAEEGKAKDKFRQHGLEINT